MARFGYYPVDEAYEPRLISNTTAVMFNVLNAVFYPALLQAYRTHFIVFLVLAIASQSVLADVCVVLSQYGITLPELVMPIVATVIFALSLFATKMAAARKYAVPTVLAILLPYCLGNEQSREVLWLMATLPVLLCASLVATVIVTLLSVEVFWRAMPSEVMDDDFSRLPSFFMAFKYRLKLVEDGVMGLCGKDEDKASLVTAVKSLDKSFVSDFYARSSARDVNLHGDKFSERQLALERLGGHRPFYNIEVQTSLGMITVAFFPRRSLLAKIGDLLKASVEHTVQQLCNCAALLVDGSFYLVYLMLLGVGQTVISSIYLAVESVKAAFWLSVYAVIAAAYAWDADSVRQAFDICRAIRDIESNVQAWRASLQIRLDQRVAERRAAHARRLEAWENGYWSFAAACMIVDSRSAARMTRNLFGREIASCAAAIRFVHCQVLLPAAYLINAVFDLPTVVVGHVLETSLRRCCAELSTTDFALDAEFVQSSVDNAVEDYLSILDFLLAIGAGIGLWVLCEIETFVDVVQAIAHGVSCLFVIAIAGLVICVGEAWAFVRPCVPYLLSAVPHIRHAVKVIDSYPVVVGAVLAFVQLKWNKEYMAGHRKVICVVWLFYTLYQSKVKEVLGAVAATLTPAPASAAAAPEQLEDDRIRPAQSTADVHA